MSESANVRSQGRVPGKPMKFGEDRTTYAEIISDLWRAVASPQSVRVCHGHTLQTLEKLITTFNPLGARGFFLKSLILTNKFQKAIS